MKMTQIGEEIFHQVENPLNTFLVNGLLSTLIVTALFEAFQSHHHSTKTHACSSYPSTHTAFCSYLNILKTFFSFTASI